MLKIEYVPVKDLKPYEHNAKLHPAEQVEQIKKSIKDYGFNDPIAVWNDTIVEGHGRLLAAQALKLKKVPVIRLDDLTDEQRREYMLVHNKTTMNSDFNIDLLDIELGDLPDFDAAFFGFDMGMDEDDQEIVEDEAPEPPEEPRTKLGDIYQLGDHRLICGDSTDPETLRTLIGDEICDLLLTDPPYGIGIVRGGRSEQATGLGRVGGGGPLHFGKSRRGKYENA